MRAVGGVFAPLIIGICLPILGAHATAAEAATAKDGDPFWNVVIEPGRSNAALLKLLALQDTESDRSVPSPVEPGEAAPVDEFAPFVEPEIVPAQGVPTDGTGEFEIVPGNATEVEVPPETEGAAETTAKVDPASYWTIYRSIPFLRTQYEANPSYRHDATMELMTGRARPTVIHHHHEASHRGFTSPPPAAIPPYIYDVYLGQIPTFIQRYLPPAIPFGYPVVW
ncbi:MAG: hypothetical protein M3552_05475 [Planctomycetota bacterium]|nr:hypothetical protein [Planctomycetaceae bacterium]MDQ3330090.1 hypothetical protein [Planctomycetota bacterium]